MSLLEGERERRMMVVAVMRREGWMVGSCTCEIKLPTYFYYSVILIHILTTNMYPNKNVVVEMSVNNPH